MKNLFYFTMLMLLLLIAGCIKTNVPFEEIKLDNYCYPFDFFTNVPQFERDKGKKFIEEELIINNDGEYQNLLKYRRGSEKPCTDDGSYYGDKLCKQEKECLKINLPQIDFSQKTLLGKADRGSCNAKEFQRNVFRDDTKKTITYSVTVKNYPFLVCHGPGLFSMNFITVQKIPDDYKVIFKPDLVRNGKYYESDRNGGWIERNWRGEITSRGQDERNCSGSEGICFKGFVKSDDFTQEEKALMKKSGTGIISDKNICFQDIDCVLKMKSCQGCYPLRKCVNGGQTLTCDNLTKENCPPSSLEITKCKCIDEKCADCVGDDCKILQ